MALRTAVSSSRLSLWVAEGRDLSFTFQETKYLIFLLRPHIILVIIFLFTSFNISSHHPTTRALLWPPCQLPPQPFHYFTRQIRLTTLPPNATLKSSMLHPTHGNIWDYFLHTIVHPSDVDSKSIVKYVRHVIVSNVYTIVNLWV